MIDILLSGIQPDGDFPEVLATKGKRFDYTHSHPNYVGGMPVGVHEDDGLVVGGATDQIEVVAPSLSGGTNTSVTGRSNFLGLLMNNSQIDIDLGYGQKGVSTDIGYAIPTIVYPPCKLSLFKGVNHQITDDRAPFIDESWDEDDLIYITDSATAALNGRLTRAASNTNTGAIGMVFKAPANQAAKMIALFWMVVRGPQTVS